MHLEEPSQFVMRAGVHSSLTHSLRLSLVRGDWTEWTIWTECSQTCHHGNQTRYRTCVNPLPESGLELVCGDVADTEIRSCLISNCSKWVTVDSFDLRYIEWFSFEFRKIKPKQLLWPNTTVVNNPMNQSELEANTCRPCQARENACE